MSGFQQRCWSLALTVAVAAIACGLLLAPVAFAQESSIFPTPTPSAPDRTPIVAADSAQATTTSGATVNVMQPTNIRSGPGTNYRILATAQSGAHYAITGKAADGTWWQIDFAGQPGWMFARLVQAENAGEVPVVGAPAPSAPVAAAAKSGGPAPVTFDPGSVRLHLEPILSGLKEPTFVTVAPDDSGRFFVLERTGRVLVFAGPQAQGKVVLDLVDRVGSNGPEQGLLGLAFAPNFSSTGYLFVNYTNKDGDTIISRYHFSDSDQVDGASEFIVMSLRQPAPNHNGGMLTFGLDGYLWIGVGDGGGANDPFHSGQNPGSLFAKILRLDVTSDPTVPYVVPPDNPGVLEPWQGQEVRDETWAMGLRNPWRFSFDRATGDLWIADVGQDQVEEVDFVPATQVKSSALLNFGWPVLEGTRCQDSANCGTGFTAPEFDYKHAGNGCSVTGGYVYRGQANPALRGVYLYADFCSGNIWGYWRSADGQGHTALLLANVAAISSFGEDNAGELYATDFGGGVVYHLTVE